MHGLNELRVGGCGRVLGFDAGCAMRRRLLDLGFTEGARAECLFDSPQGDPRAYRVRGTVIALRNRDARGVLISPDGWAEHGCT